MENPVYPTSLIISCIFLLSNLCFIFQGCILFLIIKRVIGIDVSLSQLLDNASERGVRKIKIKQKVSGCFRTDSGADDFAKLHSIAETAMKNGNSKFNAILAVVQQ